MFALGRVGGTYMTSALGGGGPKLIGCVNGIVTRQGGNAGSKIFEIFKSHRHAI